MKRKQMWVLILPASSKVVGIFWSSASALRYGREQFGGVQQYAAKLSKAIR